MKLKNLKHILDGLSEAELENPALLWHPFYMRLFEVQAYEALGTICPEQGPDDRLVLITTARPVR